MMAKEPLITRKTIKEHQMKEMQKKQHETEEYRQKEKEINDFYRKEAKRNKPVTKSRRMELEKRRERDSILNKAIIIVGILVAIVLLAAFFL